jgi:hypothetical protein
MVLFFHRIYAKIIVFFFFINNPYYLLTLKPIKNQFLKSINMMNEEFLYFLWKFRLLYPQLITESGDPLTILHPGERNTDSGPDFVNARLRIGNTLWAGNVEIHIHASDWIKHRHQDDHAYDNIILHVVYENDLPVKGKNNTLLPTLVVENKFAPQINDNYQLLMLNHQWIPCFNQIHAQSDPVFNLWAPSLFTKGAAIDQLWENCDHDWEETFYRHLAMNFGFKINAFPFVMLAKSLPLKIIQQHVHDFFQLESLLFGQAGMLEQRFTEDYPGKLAKEYKFLRSKYGLTPIPQLTWKFLRLRPSNFPTLRISQWADFLSRTKGRFFGILDVGSFQQLKEMLNVCSSPYWNDHYCFEKPSENHSKFLGNQCLNLLIINGLVPFMFYYGDRKSQPLMKENAIHFLEQLPPETNNILKHWKKVGINGINALQTQALIELKKGYCDLKRCLNCRIGNKLLANSKPENKG